MSEKPDRHKLLQNFVNAALALMGAGLSGLSPAQAVQVDRVQKLGGDVCLIFSPGAGTIVGALHMPSSDADPVPLFKILIPFPEGVAN